MCAAGHGGASPAPGQEFTLGTLLEFCIVPICLHFTDPHIGQPVLKDVAHLAVLYPAAGKHIAGGQNSKVGNVFEDRLADVWVCELEAYRDYTKFKKCAKCELLAWCRGCPAVASGAHGDFYDADPQCWKEVE